MWNCALPVAPRPLASAWRLKFKVGAVPALACPPAGFISKARSSQASADPSVHEKLVAVFAASGPLLLEAPESAEPLMLHCCVVDAPLASPWPFAAETTSMTHAF